MLAVKKECKELDKWNKKVKILIKDLEDTISGYSNFLSSDKENYQLKSRKTPIRTSQIPDQESKADPNTLQKIIRLGIYNLRKSTSLMPSSNSRQSNSVTCRSSSIGGVHNFEFPEKPLKKSRPRTLKKYNKPRS